VWYQTGLAEMSALLLNDLTAIVNLLNIWDSVWAPLTGPYKNLLGPRERQRVCPVNGWRWLQVFWELMVKFSGNLWASSETTGGSKVSCGEETYTTETSAFLWLPGQWLKFTAYHLYSQHFVLHSSGLLGSPYKESSYKLRETCSAPRKLPTIQSSHLAHAFHLCAFRAPVCCPLSHNSYAAKCLVFTRRNWDFDQCQQKKRKLHYGFPKC
jgi:hypothetical protein